MKIATYNIASGGFTTYSSAARKPQRIAALQQAIEQIDADVIGLTDTFRWADIFTAQDIQKIFRYPYAFHVAMDDTRVDKRIGVALLSRYPLAATEVARTHNRNAIKATINKDGAALDCVVLYLDDISEATRVGQGSALITQLDAARPTVIIGDYNALWPRHAAIVRQDVEQTLLQNPAFAKRADHGQLIAAFDELCQARVLPLFEHAGFKDTGECLPTAFTPLSDLWANRALFPIDHILAKNCQAAHYTVYNSSLFDSASDHYPLSAEVLL